MSHHEHMHVLDARAASFDAVKPKGKKRTSNAKAKKSSFSWDFAVPSIEQLAQAGFYYSPTAQSEDNVTCFHCHNSLDHWEEGDDPFREHLAVVPDCAWAIVTAVERGVTEANDEHDPLSEEFLEARKATFGTSWPFEKKKGWTPKVQKLAEAGWHYFPSAESDDYTKCAYCALCLDGWEPKDKPIDEHKRRSPECHFFRLADLHKKSRKKKPRASKASRASSQSVANTTLDENTGFDESAHPDDSIATTATDATTASITSTVSQTGGKAKKNPAKTGARSTKVKKAAGPEQTQVQAVNESVVELEIEPPAAQKSTRGKKRTTTEVQTEAEVDAVAPPRKRASRARASVTQSLVDLEQSFASEDPMADNPEELSVPKRGTKERWTKGAAPSRTTSRTASTGRKVSSRKASAASTVPRRQPDLDEGEIDAILEADLERPDSDVEMPDVEGFAEPNPESKPKRQPRSKAAKKSASKAPVGKVSDAAAGELPESRNTCQDDRPDKSAYAMDNSINLTKINSLFTNPYDGLNTQDIEDGAELVEQPDAKPKVEPVKAKGKGKKTADKTIATAAKGKKGKSSQKTAATTPEPEESSFEANVHVVGEEPTKTETTELRFSSSFEHEPSMLEEVKVPAELVEHFSPKKRGLPAKSTRPTKATKNAKPIKATKKAPVKAALAKPEVEDSVHLDENRIMETQPENTLETTRQASPSPARPDQHVSQPRFQSPTRAAPGGFPSPTPSPQSSNAENEPPSSRPSQKRPPLAPLTPGQDKANNMRVSAAAEVTTPTKSIRRDRADENDSPHWALKSSFPWRPVDLDTIFLGSPNSKQMKWFAAGNQTKENLSLTRKDPKTRLILLTSPERKMTVEEWINYNADRGEEKLRNECERVVGRFESQGVDALKALEGLEVQD